MLPIIIVTSLSFLFFFLEVLIYQSLGRFFLPNLSLIFVLFLNFSLGVRYSLFAAVLLGLLHDSLGVGFFGLHILSFVGCAFMAALLQKYIYQRGSVSSRLIFIFILVVVDFLVQFIFNLMANEISFMHAFVYIFLPEVMATLILTNLIFDKLKLCVLKFFV